MLINQLKKENMLALKEHDQNKRAVLSVLINKYMLLQVEARTTGKELKDEDVLQIIAKTIKELDDEISSYKTAGKLDTVKDIEAQKAVIASYLPKQLSEDEIKAEIAKLDDKSIPSVMKHFKANFAGKVDMGLVNKIARTL